MWLKKIGLQFFPKVKCDLVGNAEFLFQSFRAQCFAGVIFRGCANNQLCSIEPLYQIEMFSMADCARSDRKLVATFTALVGFSRSYFANLLRTTSLADNSIRPTNLFEASYASCFCLEIPIYAALRQSIQEQLPVLMSILSSMLGV